MTRRPIVWIDSESSDDSSVEERPVKSITYKTPKETRRRIDSVRRTMTFELDESRKPSTKATATRSTKGSKYCLSDTSDEEDATVICVSFDADIH